MRLVAHLFGVPTWAELLICGVLGLFSGWGYRGIWERRKQEGAGT